MILSPTAVRLGFMANTPLNINRLQAIFSLTGGMGFTSRRSTIQESVTYKDLVYGFFEFGLKFGYQFKKNA
jgi:hypothetical protein